MKIPDRWLDYSAVGGIVPGTSFVPFKVPLYHVSFNNLLTDVVSNHYLVLQRTKN